MPFAELRVRIPEDLYKKFRHICIELNLTSGKQVTALLRAFVESAEVNKKYIKDNPHLRHQNNQEVVKSTTPD